MGRRRGRGFAWTDSPARRRQGARLGRRDPAGRPDQHRHGCRLARRRRAGRARRRATNHQGTLVVDRRCRRRGRVANGDPHVVERRQGRHRCEHHPARRRRLRVRLARASELPRPVPPPGRRRTDRTTPQRCRDRGRPGRPPGTCRRLRAPLRRRRPTSRHQLPSPHPRPHPRRCDHGVDELHRQAGQHLRARAQPAVLHGRHHVRPALWTSCTPTSVHPPPCESKHARSCRW